MSGAMGFNGVVTMIKTHNSPVLISSDPIPVQKLFKPLLVETKNMKIRI